jgi:acetolactate synthase-1/2/3 large subunit
LKQRVSDYIADFFISKGITQVFTVVGGGAMFLNDSFGHNQKINCIYNHHEQACAMAAESYYRIAGRPAVVCVTSGPGGINAMNGVVGAYMDSIPMIVISGQMKREQTTRYTGLKVRSLGSQEFDIVSAVKGMTKYVEMVTDEKKIKYILEKAYYTALNGRPGPCWIDVPLDMQSAQIDANDLEGYEKEGLVQNDRIIHNSIDIIAEKLKQARRPVFYAGYGLRIADALNEFLSLIEKIGIPVVTTWNGVDLIATEHKCFCGHGGTIGDRAGNFAVQNSDLLLCVGTKLGTLQVGYNIKSWARNAYVVMVDIDKNELTKPTIRVDLPVESDAKYFLKELQKKIDFNKIKCDTKWLNQCQKWKNDYPVVTNKMYEESNPVNIYAFIDTFSRMLPEKTVTVAANGSASVVSSQMFHLNKDNRFIMNCSTSSMGYDLPAAIGASVALGNKSVCCLAGDGSIMMNLQELQTIVTNKLPVKIFIINNSGYHQIRQTQNNIFHDGLVGVGPESHDLGFPDFEKLASAFGLKYTKISKKEEMRKVIREVLNYTTSVLCEVHVSTTQNFEPKSSTKKLEDGTLFSPPLEDLSPFLPHAELKKNMYIPLLTEDK